MVAPSSTREDDKIQKSLTEKKSRAKNGYYAEPWVEDKEAIGQKLVEQRVDAWDHECVFEIGRISRTSHANARTSNSILRALNFSIVLQTLQPIRMGTCGAAVARVIPVSSGHPQGHPFKSGQVHHRHWSRSSMSFVLLIGGAEALFLQGRRTKGLNM